MSRWSCVRLVEFDEMVSVGGVLGEGTLTVFLDILVNTRITKDEPKTTK